MTEPPDPSLPPPAAEPPADTPPSPSPAPRRLTGLVLSLAAALLFVAAVAATPFWAPAVMPLLPWGPAPPAPPAPPAAPPTTPAPTDQNAAATTAALQQLAQRMSALEARPAPNLTPIQQQLTTLTAAVADLTAHVAAIDKEIQALRPAAGTSDTALVLVLLQIREAMQIARPFAAEYNTLVALAHAHPEIAAAAAPLAEPAVTGVASRAVLTQRLHQLAAQAATASEPPVEAGWVADIMAQLRSLVTIRRIGGAGQSPSETAVSAAEIALAGGDLAGAIAALGDLTGANQAAVQPWLQMARERLLVETTLRQIEALVIAQLGAAR